MVFTNGSASILLSIMSLSKRIVTKLSLSLIIPNGVTLPLVNFRISFNSSSFPYDNLFSFKNICNSFKFACLLIDIVFSFFIC